ncbi:hypothetical protein CKF54_05415 [Psittacicella hinzii]|uniref:Type I restriction modification DNA specificity domain-containing protein n=1 Tax=Psittacicella hinzii TaxID=2028575 RepID=A0A3A1Y3U9_9GAMM|nr:restriction endonuclease subunit S [Psittacicella hinzii]RIY32090.1 hypothetical protein CKF54_05415 [Psittacicella hinzii]
MTLPDYTGLTLKEKEELRQRTELRPPLRFSEFTIPWRTARVEDVFDKVTAGKHILVAQTKSKPDSEYCYPTYSSQTKNYGIVGYHNQYLFEKAVVWTNTGYAGVTKFIPGKFFAMSTCGVLLSDKGYCNNCMAEAIGKTTNLYVTVGVQPKLMAHRMAKVMFSFPEELEEQLKISKLFAELDKLIYHSKEAKKNLYHIRKKLIAQMYTLQDGIPLLGFPEFYQGENKESQRWQMKLVKDIVTFYNTKRVPIKAAYRVAGPTPYYGATGIIDYVEGYTHDGENILLAEDGASDMTDYPVNLTQGKIWVNNHAHVLRAKEGEIENMFLATHFRAFYYEPICVGTTRQKLNKGTLEKMEITFPSYEEQLKLGKFFRDFQALLDAYDRRIELLELQKKALLQQMFC